ncbi:hypothetical protein AUR64_18655 [Haloprofundus marisrubri]|uniref:ABC transmembrane type-1 domain-containing protein n=1 Tax=Haloprofundus marisrubri TaxID=1514971 RepID=A0A0W1R5I5_9EURY|nr:ABC transporter permease [Haloprofundus marisrubri]KTG08686.1 hypothetical protein AUR64_18655 [Haloprofundus marisrubri]
MTTGRYLLRRTAWTLFVAYLILSATFFVFAFTPDPNQQGPQFGMSREEAEEFKSQYAAAHNYDEPLADRYVEWMTAYATLEFGYSYVRDRPVSAVLGESIPVTLAYLVPALLFSLVGGVLLGLLAAMFRGGPLDWVVSGGAYVGMGVPAFVAAVLVTLLAGEYAGVASIIQWSAERSALSAANLPALVVPAVVVALNLSAVMVRYARAESLEYLPAEFVKTLRANGARTRDVARHVLKNASVPLFSVAVSELLTVLFVSVIVVEVVFGIPGFGRLAFVAIEERDIGVILATTFVPVAVGLGGNLLQDIVYAVLDPRIETE